MLTYKGFMDYIQTFTFIIAAVVSAKLLFSYRMREISFTRFAGWLILWLLFVLFVFVPGLADKIASFSGVDRGTDMAFFGAFLMVFYILFKFFSRLEKLERNITTIVRELALREDKSGKGDS